MKSLVRTLLVCMALISSIPYAQGDKGYRRRAQTNDKDYDILENGAGKFRVEIEGLSVGENVQSITVEDLVIDEREMTTGCDWDYRVYGPGDAHYGSVNITTPNSFELYNWWLETSRGMMNPRQISIDILDKKGESAVRYNFFDCLPTTWTPIELDSRSDPDKDVATETLTVNIGYVEFAGGRRRERRDRKLAQTVGAEVTLLNPDGTGVEEPLGGPWESVQGGGGRINAEPPGGSCPYLDVTTLTIGGDLTTGRGALYNWLNEFAIVPRKNVQIEVVRNNNGNGNGNGNGGDSRPFTYEECFPTRYVFPKLSASGTGNLYESLDIKVNKIMRA